MKGWLDSMVRPEGARFVLNRLRAKKKLVIVEGDNHILTFRKMLKAVKSLKRDSPHG